MSEFLKSHDLPDPPELPAPPVNPLRLTDAEAKQHALASQAGWTSPSRPERIRPLTERIVKAAKVVNMLYEQGKRTLTAADLGAEFVKLVWKDAWIVNNGLGDLLGKSGLRLQVTSTSGGNTYKIPDAGITPEYLHSIGYDI